MSSHSRETDKPHEIGQLINVMQECTGLSTLLTAVFHSKGLIMKALFLTVAAIVLSLSMTSSAEASGQAPGKSGGSFQTRGGFHGQFRGHHAYSHNYRGFNQRRWFGNYGCYGHYCPQRACWYYMYQNCYVPINYAPIYSPIQASFAPVTPNLAPNVAPNLPPVKPVKPI